MSTRLAIAIAFLLGVTAGVAAKTMNIAQHGLALSPTSATISRGDQLVFSNDDDVIHNIHIFGPGPDDSVDLGLQKPGKSLSYKFEKSGAYRVRCNIHPSVKMSVVVRLIKFASDAWRNTDISSRATINIYGLQYDEG